jgi:hypothetical protein
MGEPRVREVERPYPRDRVIPRFQQAAKNRNARNRLANRGRAANDAAAVILWPELDR